MSTKWDEIREVWQQDEQEETMSVSTEVMSYLEKDTRKLDMEVAEQRTTEWLGCLAAIGISAAVYAFADNAVEVTGAILLGAAALLAGGYLWFSSRPMPLPDLATSLDDYRAALADKFDSQIRLARQAKYWCEAPTFLGLTTWQAGQILERIERGKDHLWLHVAFVVLFNAFLGWHAWRSEVKAVSELQRRRDELLRTFDSGDPPPKPPRTYPLGLDLEDRE